MPSTTRMRADAARNRARLLAVARRELARTGEVPPLYWLAHSAGVGAGTAYRHFPTTESVLVALGEDGMLALLDTVRDAARHEDPQQGLTDAIDFVVRGALRDPGIAAILEDADRGNGEPSPMAIELGTLVETLLARVSAAGAIRGNIDAGDIRRLLVGLVGALRAAGDHARVEVYLDVLLHGLYHSL